MDDLLMINSILSGRGAESRKALIPSDYQNLTHLKNYFNQPNFLE